MEPNTNITHHSYGRGSRQVPAAVTEMRSMPPLVAVPVGTRLSFRDESAVGDTRYGLGAAGVGESNRDVVHLYLSEHQPGEESAD